MKKICSLLGILAFLALQLSAQKVNTKVVETIQSFPYQHSQEIDAALISMKTWKKSDWKTLYNMLDDDSLKLKATYALNAFVNKASLSADQKQAAKQNLGKGLKQVKSEYAKKFVQAQLNLLTDQSEVDQYLASLPKTDTRPPADPLANSHLNASQQLLLAQDLLEAKVNPLTVKQFLNRVSRIPGISSFMLASKYLNDPIVNKDAAIVIARLAISDETIQGPAVRESLEKTLPLIKGEDSVVLVKGVNKLLKKMPYDYGYNILFNGKDLSGWKALVANPILRAKMGDSALKVAEAKENEKTKGDWMVKDGLLIFTGHGDNLATAKQYADFEMYVDWKITAQGDAGIYLRGTPQVQIWDTSRREVGAQVGSGGLYNNQKNQSKPLVVADNKIGSWNNFHIIMKGEKVTGDGIPIKYKDGGTFTYTTTFPYKPEMNTSMLTVAPVIYEAKEKTFPKKGEIKEKVKFIELPSRDLVPGVIYTPTRILADQAATIADHGYQKEVIISRTGVVYFKKNKFDLDLKYG
ncbi:MAG: DUF1080 domain-containing protein, partial [Bacteroidota bacterium]